MITRAPIIHARSKLRLNQVSLDRVYSDHQNDTFKVDNVMVYQVFSKMFTDMDTFFYVKQTRGMQDGQAVFFNIHKHFLCPDHVARQAIEAEGKLQNSHYDGERKMWDWDTFVALHEEQHTIMENLTDYGYSGMENCTMVCHFLQGIKSPELEAAVNVVGAQPEKYGTDFDTVVSYLGKMVPEKRLIILLVQIATTRSQLVRPKVATFMEKVECKKYPKAVRKSINREQQMQFRKLQEQQGIKPATRQTSADAKNSAREAKIEITSQPKQDDVKEKEGETPKEPKWGKNKRNSSMTCQKLGAKCKEPG